MTFEKTLRSLIKEVKSEKRMNLVNEYGYARVRQMMQGIVPTINTLGILTAENPDGKPASAYSNNQSNKRLTDKLQSLNYGFIPIQGKFRTPESSFIVPNMTRDDAIFLGDKFGQEAVIWGYKVIEEVGEPFFRFEYINRGTTLQTRDVTVTGAGDKKVNPDKTVSYDNYSSSKGRMFHIPFFDEKYDGAKPMDGGRRISRVKSEVPDDDTFDDLMEKINFHVEASLQESRTARSRWHHRGAIKEYKKKLDEALSGYKKSN